MIKNKIVSFLHCKKCLNELPPNTSPQEYARFEFGATIKGYQLWCVRHNKNIIALDLLGQKVSLEADKKYN